MKLEDFDIDKMYTFNVTVYSDEKTKYAFQKGETSHNISGIMFADNSRDALEKVYEFLGVEFNGTMCYPNVRHFISEQIPYISKDGFLCTGFSTR